MGDAIYQPKGRAREYADWAANTYRGCDHACAYCYVPNVLKMTRQDFEQPRPRPTFLKDLERDAERLVGRIDSPVLLSFTSDPYQSLDAEIGHTRKVIQVLHRFGHKVQTLTKGGRRALRDMDLFGPGDMFATSLTLIDPDASAKWERGAAAPDERIEVLKLFYTAGIPTWVSLEPVISPDQTLELIKRTAPFVTHFKVGTINYVPNHSKSIDWRAFAHEARWTLDESGRTYFIKADLQKYLDMPA